MKCLAISYTFDIAYLLYICIPKLGLFWPILSTWWTSHFFPDTTIFTYIKTTIGILFLINDFKWLKWKCLLLLDKLTALMDWAATSRQFSCRPITCIWLFYSSKLRRRWLPSGRGLSRFFLYQSNYPFFWYIWNPMFNFGAIKNWPTSLFWTRKINYLY